MVKAELGTKRTCPSCAARFYDLMKHPIVCPKCGQTFIAEALLPSKGGAPAAPKPRPLPEPVLEAVPDVELVSLEEAEPAADDEAAAIEGVDLGEDVEVEGVEDDVFLEAEEEDEAVPDIISGPGKAD